MFYSLLSENAGATDHSIMLVGPGTLATCRTAGQIAKPDQKRRLNQVPYKDPKFVFLFLSWPFSLFLESMSFRPTVTLWYIVAAPFVTLAALLDGRLEGLWVLFFSHLVLTLTTIVPTFQGFGPVFTRFSTGRREVWLTIDDGPDPETTPRILKLLDQFGAKATFFLIGQKASQWPALAQQILAAGHSIGNHTHSHPVFQFWRFTPKQIHREIAGFERVARAHGLPVPVLFRPPAGMKNPFVHPIVASHGLWVIGWNARAFDTRTMSSDRIVGRIVKAAATGSIILLHEGSPVALAALSKLLDSLAGSGIQCVIPKLQELRTNAVD